MNKLRLFFIGLFGLSFSSIHAIVIHNNSSIPVIISGMELIAGQYQKASDGFSLISAGSSKTLPRNIVRVHFFLANPVTATTPASRPRFTDGTNSYVEGTQKAIKMFTCEPDPSTNFILSGESQSRTAFVITGTTADSLTVGTE